MLLFPFNIRSTGDFILVEGIIPAVESSHAIAHGLKLAAGLPQDQIVIINLSGRGDKDVAEIASILKNQK
jgi:tryptophan synthase beta subunit